MFDLRRPFCASVFGLILCLAVASPASAALITVTFGGLTGVSSYDEKGFHFQFTLKNDATSYVNLADSPEFGDNDLVVTHNGGEPFSLVSMTYLIGLWVTITGSDGQTVHVLGGQPFGTVIDIGINDVVSVTFEAGETATAFTELVFETTPRPVPEPATLGLFSLGLIALARWRNTTGVAAADTKNA